jgi:glutathione S-transferase
VKLYMSGNSGNAYKVRLLLELLKVPYEKVMLDTAKREHKQPEFLRINPRGEVPAIEDGGKSYWDSTACLVYIGRKHGGDLWAPADPASLAEIAQWLALAQNEIRYGLQFARGLLLKIRSWGKLEELQAHGLAGLKVIEQRLSGNDWLALDRPTIADIACYPYVQTAPQAGIPLEDFPNITRWIQRIEALPGWVGR